MFCCWCKSTIVTFSNTFTRLRARMQFAQTIFYHGSKLNIFRTAAYLMYQFDITQSITIISQFIKSITISPIKDWLVMRNNQGNNCTWYRPNIIACVTIEFKSWSMHIIWVSGWPKPDHLTPSQTVWEGVEWSNGSIVECWRMVDWFTYTSTYTDTFYSKHPSL